MKKTLALIFAFVGWFAVIAQFILMLDNRTASVAETIIRFFSFFTILTNTLVASYFTRLFFTKGNQDDFWDKPGRLTAITLYILVVGLVYQAILRFQWQPTGLQMVVDELLHSVVPLCVLLFWYLYEKKSEPGFKAILSWMAYPVVYLSYILVRGHFSGFYPYPFVHVGELGYGRVALNSLFMTVLFFVLGLALVRMGKLRARA